MQAFLILFTDILTKKQLFLIRFSMISHTSALHFSYVSHDDCIDDGCWSYLHWKQMKGTYHSNNPMPACFSFVIVQLLIEHLHRST